MRRLELVESFKPFTCEDPGKPSPMFREEMVRFASRVADACDKAPEWRAFGTGELPPLARADVRTERIR